MSTHLRVISKLAMRNIRRNFGRSLLTSLAMIVGGTLLMITLLRLIGLRGSVQ